MPPAGGRRGALTRTAALWPCLLRVRQRRRQRIGRPATSQRAALSPVVCSTPLGLPVEPEV